MAGDLQLAIGFTAARANATPGDSFWMQGGSAELIGAIGHGWAGVASVTGLHTQKTSVPQSLVTVCFGPQYTVVAHPGKHQVSIFGQALGGEADGFGGVYPLSVNGPDQSALSAALKLGGGIDVRLTRHVAVRALQADWLRTQLPNSTTNVQNTLLLGAGIVFHTSPARR